VEDDDLGVVVVVVVTPDRFRENAADLGPDLSHGRLMVMMSFAF
jgi:hypothetical protein